MQQIGCLVDNILLSKTAIKTCRGYDDVLDSELEHTNVPTIFKSKPKASVFLSESWMITSFDSEIYAFFYEGWIFEIDRDLVFLQIFKS